MLCVATALFRGLLRVLFRGLLCGLFCGLFRGLFREHGSACSLGVSAPSPAPSRNVGAITGMRVSPPWDSGSKEVG